MNFPMVNGYEEGNKTHMIVIFIMLTYSGGR